ncbi:unnamed protein product, partial [Brenthis ino]
MDKGDAQIEKLKNGETFLLWKFEFNIYIKAANLTTTISSNAKEEDKKSDALITKDAMVQRIIINSIDRKLKGHILKCKNALEMYTKLCNIFGGSEQRNKASLLQEFFTYKLQEGRSLSELISDIENLQFRLNQLGENVNEQMVMSKILSCLSSNLNYFITAWESMADDKKTLTNLTNRILSEEKRILKSSETEKQLAVQATKKNASSIIKCFKCNKSGHMKKDCKACSMCKRNNHEEKD